MGEFIQKTVKMKTLFFVTFAFALIFSAHAILYEPEMKDDDCLHCVDDIVKAVEDCQNTDVDLLKCIQDALGAASDCIKCICDILDIIGGGEGVCKQPEQPIRFAKLL